MNKMNTNQKLTRMTLGALTTAGLFSFTLALNGTPGDPVKKRYELIQIKGGEVIQLDTVVDASTYSPEDFLADKGIDADEVHIHELPALNSMLCPEGEDVFFFSTEDGMEITEEHIIEKIEGDLEHLEGHPMLIEEDVKIMKTVDEDGNVQVQKWVNGEEVEVEEGDELLQWHPNSAEEHMKVGGEVKKMIIISEDEELSPEDLDIEMLEKEGKVHKEVIVIQDGHVTGGDHDVQVDLEVKDHAVLLVSEVSDHRSNVKAEKQTPTGISEQAFVEGVTYFPNPAQEQITLSFTAKEKGATQVEIVNAEGKVMYTDNLGKFSGKYTKQIDIKDFAKGVYYINIKQKNKVMTKGLIVE